ncbi:hypothetical protein KAR91_78675 [Candidatus Pacearchaeota archaeon]|nr:hypothetical protein [Candidatus Pacearchaeota archaeon]
MIVYRIQSKQNRTRGAYDVGHKLGVRPDVIENMHEAHGFAPRHDNIDTHPPPHEDIGRWMKSDEHCGCPSAASLLRWFRGFIPDLLRAGYEIVALCDVTITAVGKYQVLFKWND